MLQVSSDEDTVCYPACAEQLLIPLSTVMTLHSSAVYLLDKCSEVLRHIPRKLFDLLHFNKVHLLVIYSCSYAANSDINLLYKPKYSRQARGSVTVIRLTFPPWAPRTAKQNRVDGDALPGMENCENAAAWPSIG